MTIWVTRSNLSRDPLFTVFYIILMNFSNDQSVLCLKLCGDCTTCYSMSASLSNPQTFTKNWFPPWKTRYVAGVAGILVLGKKHEMNISGRVEKTLHMLKVQNQFGPAICWTWICRFNSVHSEVWNQTCASLLLANNFIVYGWQHESTGLSTSLTCTPFLRIIPTLCSSAIDWRA